MKWLNDFLRGRRKRKIEEIRRLQAQLRDIESELQDLERTQELKRLYAERAQARLNIERAIQSCKPGSTEDDFIPSFPVWRALQEDSDDFDGDLERYVTEFHLVSKEDPREPHSASIARAKLKALDDCNLRFEGPVQEKLETYKMTLRFFTMWLGKK